MLAPADGPALRGADHVQPQPPAVTPLDLDSLLPGRCPTMVLIENFFRRQFEACLEQANVKGNLAACLVFGPDTFADVRRLVLGGGEPDAGQQGFPALERFCQENDMSDKQYLLLPLLTPSHGSLLVVCKPAEPRAGGGGGAAASMLQPHRQQPLVLHLDSQCDKGPPQAHQPNFGALVRFLLPYLAKDEAARQAWKTVKAVVASVPQQRAPDIGSTFMCTSALYFVASLPPYLEREEVKRLKAYRLGMVDLFEGTPACYPGFLTSKWYPSRLPDTLRKLLLSGYTHQLQASSGMVQPPSLHSHACQLADTLAKVVTAEFEMPEQRRKWQERMKEGRQLAAAQRYWVKQGGWTSQHEGSTVTCRQGAWSVQLTEQLLHSGSLRFADVEEGAGSPRVPPKPPQYDFCFCFCWRLRQGAQPLPLTVHIQSPLVVPGGTPASTPATRQVEVRFCPKPVQGGWLLQKECWEALRAALPFAPRPGDTLTLKPRKAGAGIPRSIHVDLELVAATPCSSEHTAGTADTAADAAAAGALAALAVPQLAAGSPAPPVAALPAVEQMAAAALQPTAKGEGRLQTGADKTGDPRARITIGGESYYAGYFPSGTAAAEAEDCILMWVHAKAQGWRQDWMQDCEVLLPRLNFPMTYHILKHHELLESLSRCKNKDALRTLLQQHLNPAATLPAVAKPAARSTAPLPAVGPSGHTTQLLHAVLQAAEQQEPAAAAAVGTKRPAESALTGSSLGCKRQHGAGTAMPAEGAALQRQQGQQEVLQAAAAERPPQQAVQQQHHHHSQQQQQQQHPAVKEEPQQGQQPASSALQAAHSDNGYSGSWTAAAGRQAAEALAAAGLGSTDDERFVAQMAAVQAALKALGVEFGVRLSCCVRFQQLSAMQRTGLLIELGMIAEEGSPAELRAWLQRAGAS